MNAIPRPSITEVWEWLGGTVHGRKGTCVLPDHEDTHPSASIREAEGKWRCFACSEGGDVVDLVQKAKGVGFKEALEILRQFEDVGRETDYEPASSLTPGRRPGRRKGTWTPPWRSF